MGDLVSLLVVASLATASLFLALRGSWWATAIPGAVFTLGAAAFLSGEPNPSGGDSDPGYLIGVFLLYAGAAWLLVALAVVVLVRRLR